MHDCLTITNVTMWDWPKQWQSEAIDAVSRYVDSGAQLEILVGPPEKSIHGTLISGYLYTADDGSLKIIHDRSGRPDVYPWALLAGPVLVVKVREPGKRLRTIYRHPRWQR